MGAQCLDGQIAVQIRANYCLLRLKNKLEKKLLEKNFWRKLENFFKERNFKEFKLFVILNIYRLIGIRHSDSRVASAASNRFQAIRPSATRKTINSIWGPGAQSLYRSPAQVRLLSNCLHKPGLPTSGKIVSGKSLSELFQPDQLGAQVKFDNR